MNYTSDMLKKVARFSLKTIVVACFTYAFLFALVPKTAHDHLESKFTYPSKTLIPQDIQDVWWFQLNGIIQEIEESSHQAAWASTTNTITTLCKSYQSVCAITKFDNKILSDKQKLYYQALVIYAFTKLNSMGIPALEYVDNITIKSNNARSRGFSSRNQIVLDVKSMNGYAEFLQVLIHELWHMVDLRYLLGNSSNPLDSNFTEFSKKVFPIDDPSLEFYKLSRINENTKSRYVTYKDFVSGYGGSDVFEDFAETVNFYQNYNSVFQEIAKESPVLAAKYSFIESLFWSQFINNGNKKLEQFQKDPDFRPYDTTRLQN